MVTHRTELRLTPERDDVTLAVTLEGDITFAAERQVVEDAWIERLWIEDCRQRIAAAAQPAVAADGASPRR
jgi:hypothetical protein